MLSFRAFGRRCAIRLADVVEVVPSLLVESVRSPAAAVIGAAHVHGVALPVVDLGRVFGRPLSASGEGVLVLLRLRDRQALLRVDAVDGLVTIQRSALQQLPPLLDGAEQGLLEAIGSLDEEFLMVIRASRILPDDSDAPAVSE